MTRRGGKDRGLYERDGVWYIRYHDEHGREHREAVGAKSLALKVYQKRKAEIAERRFLPERHKRRDVRIAKLLEEFAERRAGAASATDIVRYARNLAAFFGDRLVREIAIADVERYVAERSRTKNRRGHLVSAQTVVHEANFLRRVLAQAQLDGLVADNVARRARKVKVTSGRTRFLSIEEEAELRTHLSASHWAVVRFAILTGLRQGEQFAMKWEHVDLKAGVVTIPEAKGGRVRHVELNESALGILKKLPRKLRTPWVWLTPFGQRINAHNFYRRSFRKAADAASLGDVHWHDLRHTFASRLAAAGVTLYEIQQLLGHRSSQMTERYAHLTRTQLRTAVRVLDRTDTSTGKAKRA